MMGDPDDKLGKAPEPHEFRAKKPWQRLIILAGGITVNFLLAIVIFSFVSWSYGESYLPAKNAKFGIYVDPIGEKIGLRNGDKVVSLDNVPVTDLHKAAVAILLDKPKSIQVERNGEKKSLLIPEGFDLQVVDKEAMLFDAGFPFVIDSVAPETGAALAGFKKGDRLVSLESDSILFFQQFSRLFKENKGKTVSVGFVRNGKLDSANVIVKEDGSIGAYYQPQYTYFDISKQEFGFIESWGQGWNRTISVLGNYVKQFRLIFSKVGASKMGGFASIGKMYPSSWDWEAFWTTTAVISVILAFMNLLPIPVLDGGYILFILWEMITGKKVGDKFMQRALTIGMYFVLALLIFSNGNDIVRALR